MDWIVKKSYEFLLEDSNFIKLTIFAFLPYSIIFVGYLFYQTYFVLTSVQSWVHWNELKLYIENIFSFTGNHLILALAVLLLVLIAYFFIPPIAETAVIEYLDKKKWIWYAIGRGFLKFFYMFELHGFFSLFSFLFFFIVVSRLFVLNMLDPVFVVPFLIVWFIFILFFNFTWIYAKFLVVLEDMSPFDAIKKSIKLTFLNLKKTGKYFMLYLLFYTRFLINVILIVWLPVLVLYLFLKTNTANAELVRYSIYFLMFLLFILTAYISWIVEAFFISMWYNIFKEIEKE